MLVSRRGGRGANVELLFTGYRVSVLKDKKKKKKRVLEIEVVMVAEKCERL